MNYHLVIKEKKYGAQWMHFSIDNHTIRLLIIMKTILLLILLFSFEASARLSAQSVTISVRDVSISVAMDEISKQTSYEFAYNKKILKSAKPVTLNVRNEPLETSLKKLFADQPFTYTINDKIIIIEEKAIPKTTVPVKQLEQEQQEPIRGRVVNESGEPLAGATLRVKGIQMVYSTDRNGAFEIPPRYADASLQIEYLGFVSKEVMINRSDTIVLNKSQSALDEAVVIAYGTTTRRLNTGSVSKVSAKEISTQPVSNPLAALIGRVPGADIVQNNGVPGSTFSVQIRGRNSLAQGSEPLFIIDGVPFAPNNSNMAMQISLANGLSPLSSISPDDIESIEILKDADATAIYGSRGANGVVLITTKKGKAGATRLSYRLNRGFNDIANKMEMLSTEEYIALRKEAFQNDNLQPSATPGTTGYAPDLELWNNSRYTDLHDLLMGETAQTLNTSLSLGGGTEKTQFLLGGGFNRETTAFTGDSRYQKGTANFNIQHKALNDKLNLGFSTNYSVESNNLFNGGALFYINLPPNLPDLYDADGNLNWSENGEPFINPISFIEKGYNSHRKNLITRMQISYDVLDNLTLRTSIGYNDVQANEKSMDPLSTQDPQGTSYEGFAQYSSNDFSSWIVEPQIDYQIRLNRGILNLTAGGTLQSTLNEAQSIRASGYTNDQFLHSLAAATTITNFSNRYAPYKYAAVFSRINYNLNNKYLINLSGRTDGSSRFGSGRRWGNFYSIGAAWIFSNERPISENIASLSYGKLRTSYGTTGNDQIGNYQYLDTWATWRPYQGSLALYPSSLFNPNYGWEVNKKYELALETAWFKERILFSTAFFLNRSGNQLVEYILPSQTGHYSINRNFPALIENKGWESELTVKIINNNSLQWETGLNITIPKNRLLEFDDLETSAYNNSYVLGESLNLIYGYKSLGVNSETGVYEFDDVNEDGILNTSDFSVLGNRDPKYYGGWSNTLRFKGFSISTFFQFKKQTGTTILNSIYSNSQSFPGMMFNQPRKVLERWQGPGDITAIQRVSATTSSEAYRSANNYMWRSDVIYGDASFLRLKTLELSYSLPPAITKKLAAQSFNVFFQGQNLLTFTNYNGWDPETQGNPLAIPPLRSFNFGLMANF